MRYPIFHIENQFSYIFVPNKPITENMLEQLEEVWTLSSCKNKYTYVFIGTKECIIMTNSEIDENAPIPIESDLPNVYDLINFPIENDATECDIIYDKKVRPAFKAQMLHIFDNLNKELRTHIFKIDKNR